MTSSSLAHRQSEHEKMGAFPFLSPFPFSSRTGKEEGEGDHFRALLAHLERAKRAEKGGKEGPEGPGGEEKRRREPQSCFSPFRSQFGRKETGEGCFWSSCSSCPFLLFSTRLEDSPGSGQQGETLSGRGPAEGTLFRGRPQGQRAVLLAHLGDESIMAPRGGERECLFFSFWPDRMRMLKGFPLGSRREVLQGQGQTEANTPALVLAHLIGPHFALILMEAWP